MNGSGLAVVYAAAMSLIIAAHLPYGLIGWLVFWAAVIYRAASKPRTSEAHQVEGLEQSSA